MWVVVWLIAANVSYTPTTQDSFIRPLFRPPVLRRYIYNTCTCHMHFAHAHMHMHMHMHIGVCTAAAEAAPTAFGGISGGRT
jgi:hypothetical protein